MNGLLSPYQILRYLLRAVIVLVAIPFHEAAHALVSSWLGDDTAKRAGRLSLNPIRHFDPLGALCMLLGGVGWAKPVGIDPRNSKDPTLGMAISAAAGPLSNLPRRLFVQAMRYERQIMLAVLLLVFLGALDAPLSLLVDLMWDRLVEWTGFVEMWWR